AHHLCGDALRIRERLGPEVANTRLDVHLPVRLDDEQRVESGRSGDERADGDAEAAYLRADALAGLRLALVPAEHLGALVERLLHERTRGVGTLAARVRRPDRRLAFRRVDAADGDLID